MRFQNQQRTRYLSRRDQFRLTIMVGLIAFVIFAIEVAARPSSWYWLTGIPVDAQQKSDAAESREIDFKPKTERELPPGVIRVVEPEESGEPAGTVSDNVAPRWKVTREQIATIEDNSVGLRNSERDLYYTLLGRTRDFPRETLKQNARSDLSFALLMNESTNFLGELITVQGEFRRLTQIPVGQNDQGLQTVWEGWLFNRDSGTNPYCVRCSSLPEGMPTGELSPPVVVELTGYFFKRYGYPRADHNLHVAPLIIAAEPKWLKPVSMTDRGDSEIAKFVLGGAALLGIGLLLVLWRFRLGDRQFEQQHLKRLSGAPDEEIVSIGELPTVTVEESLQQFAESQLPDITISERAQDESNGA
ncbi:MAG: hypothetical protein ACYTGL_28920 [Planctomycetota bacterium]|jgi:hypothetical protein